MENGTGRRAGGEAGSGALEELPVALMGIRAAIGGVLMGLANLVPGISGGTMLLAAGVYPAFIGAIAELSTLRLRLRSLILVGTIAAAAALAILLLAGLMKDLVIERRWLMYSLFIGLTLGGVPLVWRLARPASPGVAAGALLGFALMALMQLGGSGGTPGAHPSTLLLVLSGTAGSAAMILPGVSGGYLLLLLGQYERILGAVDKLKQGLLGAGGGGPDPQLLMEAMGVVVPVGIGVAVGVIGVSNLLTWLLERYRKPTLGALLGLLFGAVVGLWPFQQPIAPQAGDLFQGRELRAEELGDIEPAEWAIEIFDPSVGQVAAALGLVAAGLGATLLIDRIGGGRSEERESE